MDGVPVGAVCERCKALALPFAVNHCQELEVYAKNFRARAERLRERDAVRYRNSSEEADHWWTRRQNTKGSSTNWRGRPA